MNTPPNELIQLQTNFSKAIFSPDREAISGNVRTQGELTAEQRVGIYRNSVHGILWKYLASLYEVCDQLLGEQFFEKLCDDFIDQHPPTTPFLSDYGIGFAQFIDKYDALSEMRWISDVAKLEWARHLAWNAVNQPASDFSSLATMEAEAQLALRFCLPDSAQLLASPYATHAIWFAHQPEEHPDKQALEDIELRQSCQIIIWRAGRELHQYALTETQWQFLSALRENKTLGEISEQFQEHTGTLLPTAIQQGWIISFLTKADK